MNRRSISIVCVSVILSIIAFSVTPSMAQKTAKACEEEWKANKAANQAAKITEKAYVEKCRVAEAKPETAKKPEAAPSKPAAPTPAAVAPKPAQVPTPAATKPEPAKPTTAMSAGKDQYSTEAQAKAHCPSDTVVYVNLKSKIYHFAGHKDYGSLKRGTYMCEKETASAGARAAKNEKHP